MRGIDEALLENVIKNILIAIILIIIFPSIQNTFIAPFFIDKNLEVNLLAAVGLVSVIACFGNFAFTYEKVNHAKFSNRLLAHLTTALLMLAIGLSLEMILVIVSNTIGNFPIFNISLLLLYIASVLYDFWDLKRAELR